MRLMKLKLSLSKGTHHLLHWSVSIPSPMSHGLICVYIINLFPLVQRHQSYLNITKSIARFGFLKVPVKSFTQNLRLHLSHPCRSQAHPWSKDLALPILCYRWRQKSGYRTDGSQRLWIWAWDWLCLRGVSFMTMLSILSSLLSILINSFGFEWPLAISNKRLRAVETIPGQCWPCSLCSLLREMHRDWAQLENLGLVLRSQTPEIWEGPPPHPFERRGTGRKEQTKSKITCEQKRAKCMFTVVTFA